LLVNTLNNATLIPSDAIQHNGQEAFVYAIENNHAHLRPITVGVTEGQTAQVQGIDPGDVLATSGFDKLQDNAQITVATRQRGNGPAGNRRAGGSQGSTGDETPNGNAPQGMGKGHGNGPNGSGGNVMDNGNAPGGNNTGHTGNSGTSSNGGNSSGGGSAPR
jgi:hypothetical protein